MSRKINVETVEAVEADFEKEKGKLVPGKINVEIITAVEAEIEALPVAVRARLIRLLEAVENVGLEALHAPHGKHLVGKLWELRVRAKGGIARGIYVMPTGRRVVVLHVFAKKSRKTPRRALETARERMRQVLSWRSSRS